MKHIRHLPIRQKGATLIEMIVYVIIGVLALAGSAWVVSNALNNSDLSEDISNTTHIINNTRLLKDHTGYGTGSLVASLNLHKKIPSGVPVSSASASNPTLSNKFNGALTVVANGNTYTVTTEGLAPENCVAEAVKLSAAGSLTVKINSSAVIEGPVSRSKAETQCNLASNKIALTSNN